MGAFGVVEGVGEADALDRRLRDAADLASAPRCPALPAPSAPCRSHARTEARISPLASMPLGQCTMNGSDDAAAVGLALPSPERGVAGEGPAPRVVVEVLRPAEVVERGEVLLQVVGHVVEELVLVDRAVRPALGARAVVGDHHDQRVVELADRLQEVEQPPDVVIGVLEEAGEHLHHAGVEPAFVGGELVPLLHVGVVPRQHGVRGDDAQLLLPREHLLAVGVPAVVELALVLVGPFLRAPGAAHGWRRSRSRGRTACRARPA